MLTTPCVLQEVATVPPPLDVATDKIDSAVAKFKGAANTICAPKAIPMIPRRVENINGRCFVNEFSMDTEVERVVV